MPPPEKHFKYVLLRRDKGLVLRNLVQELVKQILQGNRDSIDLSLPIECVVYIKLDHDFLLSCFESECEFLSPGGQGADFSFFADKLFLVHSK